MSKQKQILIVDDEPLNLAMAQRVLEKDYAVQLVTSGRHCLDSMRAKLPDILLLDVNMPDLNGYETCKQIKGDPALADVPVIFVSALDSLDERLAGYEVGAEDYITKPVAPQELKRKVDLTLAARDKARELAEAADYARSAAMQAMTSSSELGRVLQFFRESFACEEYAALAQAVLDTVSSLDLKASVQIRGPLSIFNLDVSGVAREMEASILSQATGKGRIFDFGRRSIFNDPSISLLIKDMPVDDPDRYGRLKDHLALLVEGAGARVKAIDMAMQLLHQQVTLTDLMDDMVLSMGDIANRYKDHKVKSTEIMDELLRQVEASFLTLGLSEEQEESLMEVIHAGVTRSLALYDRGLETDEKLHHLLTKAELGNQRNKGKLHELQQKRAAGEQG